MSSGAMASTSAAAGDARTTGNSTIVNRKMELEHWSHREHPLKFKEEQKNEDGLAQLVICNGCRDPVLGPSYSCNESKYCHYNLHESCAELPNRIHHPRLHKHQLVLVRLQSTRKVCIACKQNFIGMFGYKCVTCKLYIHTKCASNLYDIIENDSHQHNFTILWKMHKFDCDVCGEDRTGPTGTNLYSVCSICQLLVHEQCAWLPRYVKISSHPHDLKLTWFLEDIFPKNRVCSLCNQNVHKSRAVYYCHECESFVADTACTKDTWFLDRENPGTTIVPPDGDESEKMNQPKDELGLAAQFKHFSHQHFLALNISDQDHELFKDITCDGCMRPISITDAFYSCKEQEEELPKSSCHFFLHKTCAQLPMKRLLPAPQYLLTLIPKAPSIDGVFECFICDKFSQGFAYSIYAEQRFFRIDLFCSILLEYRALTHESHIHALHFNRRGLDSGSCSGCSTSSIYFCFSCRRCNFNLCMTCVKLPPTSKHRYDLHPLKLSYGSVENEVGEYYCEICEGERDPKNWFYSCPDCDFDCHPHCILGRNPQVKLGGIYDHHTHSHLVTLVDKRRSVILNDKRERIRPCEVCDGPCEGLVYECSECNINIHRDSGSGECLVCI